MSHIGDTKHVRIEATTRAKLKAYSKKTGISMGVIVTWCIEDCLMAVENKKSILPRILLMQQAVEGPRFEALIADDEAAKTAAKSKSKRRKYSKNQ